MRRYCTFICLLGSLLGCKGGVSFCAPSANLPISLDCDPVTGCPAVITAAKFQSYSAFQFNSAGTIATVVPALGRVMSFASNGKNTFNWLWNNQSPHKSQSWQNWGGSKTWLAPQSDWPQIAGSKWPPDSAWNKVVKSEVQTGGFLKATGVISPHSGIRINKQYGHDETGNFFIRQTAEKVTGKPLRVSLWSVTQIGPPEAVFFLLDSKNTFKKSTFQLQGSLPPQIHQRGDLACYIPRDHTALKIGITTATPVLAALRDNQLFVLRAKPRDAIYPDAMSTFPQGFPIEIFDSGIMPQRYLELELYSPLRSFHHGTAWTFTVTWNVYPLSTTDLQSPQLWKEVKRLLGS